MVETSGLEALGVSGTVDANARSALRALASTVPLTPKASRPEVSTTPPSPPSIPPRANISPANSVTPSDHATTVPPLPKKPASALSRLFSLI